MNATGQIEVITGPMFSGKSEELIRIITRSQIAGLKTIRFKPAKDTRTDTAIRSRTGQQIEAITVAAAADIMRYVNGESCVVGIDEAHFFGPDIVGVAKKLAREGKRVVVAGLDLDFREVPFEGMAALMALGSPVTKLKAVCMKCKRDNATRSQRLVDCSERELIGDKEYEPRCLNCYEPPRSDI